MNFLEKALPTTMMGVPVIRLRPGSKAAMDSGWPQLATTDAEILKKWNEETPDANCGAVATDDGIWLWEVDSPEAIARLEKDTGHSAVTEIQTFKVRSRPGRGHFYFKQNDASRAMGNISQSYVFGQDWSARVRGAYVVSQNSLHPDTGLPYTALDSAAEITEAPQWLISWLLSQQIQKLSKPQGNDAPRNERGKVPHGAIHGYLLTHAGKLRAMGLGQEEIEPSLMKLAYDHCELPLDDEKIRTMAKSICNFKPGEGDKSLLFNQQPDAPKTLEPVEKIDFSEVEYPIFPRWVLRDTSIYENFVKPYCEKNSRIDYFMWVPTAVLLMNYIGTKVRVPYKAWKPSFYLVLIGEKGRAHKSSSVKDGMKFLEFAGMLSHFSRDIKNADGKTLVWQAGSPEGLGTDMQRTNCKNAVLFYDELSTLLSKSQIEGSGIGGALLNLYESNNFANSIKSKKDAFSIAPDSYVASLVTCTTDQRFDELWGQFAGEDTGLNDRFTFILQPEELPEHSQEYVIDYQPGALRTRKLVDKAVNQGSFEFFDQTPFVEVAKKFGGRTATRAEKWALYFAVDLGLTEIDEDCVERGIAMVRYEAEARAYQKAHESRTEEAKIQRLIMKRIKKYKGQVDKRTLEREVHASRYGTSLWRKAFYGLVTEGYIAESGSGAKGDTRYVHMLREMAFGDE